MAEPPRCNEDGKPIQCKWFVTFHHGTFKEKIGIARNSLNGQVKNIIDGIPFSVKKMFDDRNLEKGSVLEPIAAMKKLCTRLLKNVREEDLNNQTSPDMMLVCSLQIGRFIDDMDDMLRFFLDEFILQNTDAPWKLVFCHRQILTTVSMSITGVIFSFLLDFKCAESPFKPTGDQVNIRIA